MQRIKSWALMVMFGAACVTPGGLPPARLVAVEAPAPTEENRVYDWADGAGLDSSADDGALRAYRDAVEARLGRQASGRGLLEAEREITQSFSPKDAHNDAALLEGHGSLRPISRLEWLLFGAQNARWPMLEHPTEFLAFILTKPPRVRVYFSSLDRVGQKPRGEVRARVLGDVNGGWVLRTVLHNHPFMFNRAVGDRLYTRPETVNDAGGALAPSSNDVRCFSSLDDLHPFEVAVTNGLETSHITLAEELGHYAGAD